MFPETGTVWNYLSVDQRALVQQGNYLFGDIREHMPTFRVSDYSFLVFPFAKAYEGYLKQLFLDLGLIKQWQYESEHFRVGKVLSPYMQTQLKRQSVYRNLSQLTGSTKLADDFWQMWKRGRNVIFHYFPHNNSAISFGQAEILIGEMYKVIKEGVLMYARVKPLARNTPKVVQLHYGYAQAA